AIAKQRMKGVPVIGDIELFARAAKAPIIAITGSNAKSTVTTVTGLMMEAAGLAVKVGGNLGIPVLDLLVSPPVLPEAYVLELSSFQLETTYTLKPQVATVLNVTPDHMDRYADFQAYRAAKQRIYQDCQIAVCNRDDLNTECGDHYSLRRFYFTLNEPVQNEFGLIKKNNENYLAFENEILMPVSALPIRGRHYQANALAALAIGHGFGLPMQAMLQVLREFKGLIHRCQLIRELKGVYWYNDSKGTNVGATLAAMEGLGSEIEGKLILIAGGVGKSADFSPLVPAIGKYVRTVMVLGEAAPILAETIAGASEVLFAKDLQEAVLRADQKAHPGDCVLLSPACASYDMFRNYEHRGEVFMQLVQDLS
ncbi:MAG TPA: UDP-N-acetylmuramoyl-L-alanine--D-glutamate ligase, partial [Gammaproteobacteria bacterium]|nr:UDP-N-acetylmuramoyl-L-alanine--D-glutamate ligase [Gammaproteobacteria bacterium]